MDRLASALGDGARWLIIELLAERPRSVGELAELTGLRQPQTTKHLQTLARAGLLVSHAGTNGGYALARPATEISAFEVIRAIDGPVILTHCFTEHGTCDQSENCTVPARPRMRVSWNSPSFI